MRVFCCFLQMVICFPVFSQQPKPLIDTSAFSKWPFVASAVISNDGNYVACDVRDGAKKGSTLLVKCLRNSWQVSIPEAEKMAFDNNNRLLVFQRKDSVGLLQLGTGMVEWCRNVESYKIAGKDSLEYIVVLLKGEKPNLVIRNLLTDEKREILSCKAFNISRDESTIFITTEHKQKDLDIQQLYKCNLVNLQLDEIWSTNGRDIQINLNNIAFDSSRSQIAFAINSKEGNSIWYYTLVTGKAVLLVDDSSDGLDKDVKIGDIADPGFSSDGRRLFITLMRQRDAVLRSSLVSVDIWSYKDPKLQSQQLYEMQNPSADYPVNYTACVSIHSREINRLSYEDENVTLFTGIIDSLAYVFNRGKGNYGERNWNPASSFSYYFVSTKAKKRKKIDYSFEDYSPGRRYLTGFDRLNQSIYVHDIISGKTYNITNAFPKAYWLDEDHDTPGPGTNGLEVAGWLTGDRGIVVYDKYDLWKVDPFGEKPAINLTKGYGRKHKTRLRLIGGSKSTSIERSSTFILAAYNERTKENGFMSLCIMNPKSLRTLSIGAYNYEVCFPSALKTSWLQANGKASFIVRRESASQSPNYFITNNFKEFVPLTSVYPEEKYNWLTAEVISWKVHRKVSLSGVLYKPQNFDAKKKYPVIINYYEKLSQQAYEYKPPAYSRNNINIPWFVSRGYIVFTPDIWYRVGHPGRSACESVISATRRLLKFKWVNERRIALQGHSWGGFETNYLVTHSNLFCAVLSAAGISDEISGYNALLKTGGSRQFFYELGQSRIGATPWTRPDIYFESSAVLRAHRVNTPILLMNNKEDAVVPFSQGIEFFTALRRLKKRVWLLQYDGEGHSVSGDAAVDYTIRMTQFFDHYCKGAPPPKWMTEGIPARLKGIDSGLELDTSGRQP